MNKFSERLKELREEKKLSRIQLAKMLDVSVRLISYWENNQRECDFDMLIKIATVFSVSADYLLGLDVRSTIDVSNLTEKQKSHIQAIIDDIRNK